MDEIYHVLTKSIAEYEIFNFDADYIRMQHVLRFYQPVKQPISFSHLDQLSPEKARSFNEMINNRSLERQVEIIAYCLMPTHVHLILQQLKTNGIARFMSNVLNSYSRYFNVKHKRKGPLWQGRYKKILVESDEQLEHLTRYIHLNPVTAYLVDRPELWQYSSYREYIENIKKDEQMCDFASLLDIRPVVYRKFVEERISDQREFSEIKKLILDDQ